jgi:hypothetical protein
MVNSNNSRIITIYHHMNELPPDTIDTLCKLSEEEICQCNARELHKLLILAIEQIERDLQILGVDFSTLKTPNRRSALQKKAKQLNDLDIRLNIINSIE